MNKGICRSEPLLAKASAESLALQLGSYSF